MKLLLVCLALSACVGDPNIAAPSGPSATSSGTMTAVKTAGTTDQPAGGVTCRATPKTTCP